MLLALPLLALTTPTLAADIKREIKPSSTQGIVLIIFSVVFGGLVIGAIIYRIISVSPNFSCRARVAADVLVVHMAQDPNQYARRDPLGAFCGGGPSGTLHAVAAPV